MIIELNSLKKDDGFLERNIRNNRKKPITNLILQKVDTTVVNDTVLYTYCVTVDNVLTILSVTIAYTCKYSLYKL